MPLYGTRRALGAPSTLRGEGWGEGDGSLDKFDPPHPPARARATSPREMNLWHRGASVSAANLLMSI